MNPNMSILVTKKKPFILTTKPLDYRETIWALVYRIGLRGFQEAFPDYHDRLDKNYHEWIKATATHGVHSAQATNAGVTITDLIHQIIDLDPEVRLNALFEVISRKKFSMIDLDEIKKCFEEHKQKVYNGI